MFRMDGLGIHIYDNEEYTLGCANLSNQIYDWAVLICQIKLIVLF
jgi:hypothetical protein